MQTDPADFEIKKLQRWIEIVIRGNEDSHEADTRVANVRVPIMVMVRRAFGDYTKLHVIYHK